MANKELGGDGDWSVAANWTGGTKPVDGDNALILGSFGSNVIMSGDEGGVDLALLDVHAEYIGLFGTSAAPIKISASQIQARGSSGFYFEIDDDGLGAETVDEAYIHLPGAGTPCELGKTSAALPATGYDKLYLARGNITLKGTAAFVAGGELHVLRTGNPGQDVRCNVGQIAVPTLYALAGMTKSQATITTAHVAGRVWQSVNPMTDVLVLPGGVLNYEHNAVSGDGTTIQVYGGGKLDLMTGGGFKTVSTVILHPDAILRYDPQIHTIPTLRILGPAKIIEP